MTLIVSTIGENPQQPGISAETFIPDQLIAGNLKLVTQPIVLAAGAQLPRGTVLGQQSSYSAIVTAGSSNVGSGTVNTIVPATGAMVGNYVLTATSPTNWTVTSPEGVALAPATTGTAYSGGGLSFTITPGGNPFGANDTFTLAVVDSIGSFITCVRTASDGSQVPVAILADYADASNGPVRTGAYVMGEFNANALSYDSSWTPELLTTALRPWAIYLKSVVSAQDAGTVVTNFA